MKYKCPRCEWVGSDEEIIKNNAVDHNDNFLYVEYSCPKCYISSHFRRATEKEKKEYDNTRTNQE